MELIIISDSRYNYHGARTVQLSQFHNYCPTLVATYIEKKYGGGKFSDKNHS